MALCTKTLSLNPAVSDTGMDAAIYHPSRNSIFGVSKAYITELGLDLSIIQTATKFANPCFSKSCMAFDSVNNKLWLGTMGDWALGYLGDPGGAVPSLGTSGLYRVNPTNLSTELFIDPSQVNFGGLSVTSPGDTGPVYMYGAGCGFYDLIYQGGQLYGALYGHNFNSVTGIIGFIVAFSAANPLGSNVRFQCPDLPLIQCAYEFSNSPARVWAVSQDSDIFTDDPPCAIGVDWALGYNQNFNVPASFGVGVHGAVVYSPTGFLYVIRLSNNSIVKYNVNGTVNSSHALGGATVGGMTMRLRYNFADGFIYIPCPATNQVLQYSPASDTVTKVWSAADGLDAPHDMVFAGTRKYVVQWGAPSIKELT